MALTLRPELELELVQEAAQRGLSPDDFVADLLEASRESNRASRNAAAIELLRSWQEDGDAEEQRETFEALREGLNESHSSYRVIFP